MSVKNPVKRQHLLVSYSFRDAPNDERKEPVFALAIDAAIYRKDAKVPVTPAMRATTYLTQELIDDRGGFTVQTAIEFMEQRICLDLDEINGTGAFANCKVDDEILALRKTLGVE